MKASETSTIPTSNPNPTVNPFYADRQPPEQPRQRPANTAIYAKLPAAPVTGSPVPHLTSLYHFEQTGGFGDRRYPGNCGGLLIRDLLMYFRPQRVLDPMTGSGTCREVCESLRIPCRSLDMRDGFDATNPVHMHQAAGGQGVDFIWAHPPYWRQKLYTNDPRDLSRTTTLDAFLQKYGSFIRACAVNLVPGGKLAILMGDYTDRDAGFVPLTYHTKRLAFGAQLRQCCTDIIRFSHGNSSSHKTYRSSFIPGLHDVCMVFEKPTTPRPRPPAGR